MRTQFSKGRVVGVLGGNAQQTGIHVPVDIYRFYRFYILGLNDK